MSMSSIVKDYYVSPHASVEGDVSLGTGCVVLPQARIIAESGVALHLGNYCVVEEHATICVRLYGDNTTVTVGNYNLFSARSAVVHFKSIGDGNVFRPFCSLVDVSSIGDFNVFTSFVRVDCSISGKLGTNAMLSRCTVVGFSPSANAIEGSQKGHSSGASSTASAFAVVPRYGSRSVAELPTIAQSLLAMVEGRRGAAAALAENAEGDRVSSDATSEASDEREEAGDAGSVDSGGDGSQSSRSDASDALDTITPQKQRLTAHHIDVCSAGPGGPQEQQQRQQTEDAITPEAVQAMLAVLPEQVEKATVQEAVKRCRYYLTLHAVL